MKLVMLMSIIFPIVCAYVSARVTGGMFRHPNYPGMCTLDETMILAAGQVKLNPHGECGILTCYKNGHATMMRCLKQGMRDGCREGKVIDPYAPYPECCRREITCKTYYYSQKY